MKREKLLQQLSNGDFCCAVLKGEMISISKDKGIKPLLSWLNEDIAYFQDGEVIDKIVGKAAALLLVLGKVKSVYGQVMSEGAVAVLKANKIPYEYGCCVPYIINRTNTGMCPMEQTVAEIDNPREAHVALKQKVAELSASK